MELEIGQVWYMRRPGATTLIKARITDVTAKTVEITPLGQDNILWGERYERTVGIEFVELFEPAEKEEAG